MPLFRRSDGDPIPNLPTLRRMMPFVMPTRNESAVYFDQEVDVTETLQFVKDGDGKFTLFHVLLCAMARTVGQRDQLNRFVVGRRVYQRKKMEFSFAVKKSFADDAKLTTVKVEFQPDDTVEGVAARVNDAIGIGRGKELTTSEKEMKVVTRLPHFVLGFAMWLQRWLDGMNLLPGSMIRPDPLYASMFLANLGSLGIDAAYHHLYEYGTVPLFAVIGRVKKAQVVGDTGDVTVRDVLTIRYTLDERVADGFYCARSLEIFKKLVEAPAELA